jgi:hypothetical protein
MKNSVFFLDLVCAVQFVLFLLVCIWIGEISHTTVRQPVSSLVFVFYPSSIIVLACFSVLYSCRGFTSQFQIQGLVLFSALASLVLRVLLIEIMNPHPASAEHLARPVFISTVTALLLLRARTLCSCHLSPIFLRSAVSPCEDPFRRQKHRRSGLYSTRYGCSDSSPWSCAPSLYFRICSCSKQRRPWLPAHHLRSDLRTGECLIHEPGNLGSVSATAPLLSCASLARNPTKVADYCCFILLIQPGMIAAMPSTGGFSLLVFSSLT